MKPSGNRAVAYVRVSTEEQVDGHSLQAQRREIERYASQHSLTLVRIYSDEGVSAHTDRIEKRPQLCALLGDAGRDAFDVVLVHTLDRWARNIRVQSEAFERLGRAGVGFVSLTENFDFTTASGRMMLTVMGGVSEFFSDQLGVHVLKAQRQRAEAGLPVGPVPFGYVTGPPGEPPNVDSAEAEAVRGAFASRAAGLSNGAIAAGLNGCGFRTRTGRLFTAHALKDLFNCRFYTGVVVFRDQVYPGRHEALVSGELFDRVQARRARRGPHRAVSDKPRGVLAGIIKCARHCTPSGGAGAAPCTGSGTGRSAKRTDDRSCRIRWTNRSPRSSDPSNSVRTGEPGSPRSRTNWTARAWANSVNSAGGWPGLRGRRLHSRGIRSPPRCIGRGDPVRGRLGTRRGRRNRDTPQRPPVAVE